MSKERPLKKWWGTFPTCQDRDVWQRGGLNLVNLGMLGMCPAYFLTISSAVSKSYRQCLVDSRRFTGNISTTCAIRRYSSWLTAHSSLLNTPWPSSSHVVRLFHSDVAQQA